MSQVNESSFLSNIFKQESLGADSALDTQKHSKIIEDILKQIKQFQSSPGHASISIER